MTGLPDDDLSHLSPEDRQRVRAWAEDRLINAITPLRWQLQRLSTLERTASPALIAARDAVMHVMAAIDEARAAAETKRALEPCAPRDPVSDVPDREIVAAKRAETPPAGSPAREGSSGNPDCRLPADRCTLSV
jgi:hypothetical protein